MSRALKPAPSEAETKSSGAVAMPQVRRTAYRLFGDAQSWRMLGGRPRLLSWQGKAMLPKKALTAGKRHSYLPRPRRPPAGSSDRGQGLSGS